tara:strand:- start:65 stop:478 length:414 start_codon:yes stop_codon:yes gene_type:complete
MRKIIITEKQYKKILEHEKRNISLITEADKTITVDLDVLLAIGSLLGLNITGHNKINADEALKDESTLIQIKNILETPEKLDELISSLEIKGMINPIEKLKEKQSSLISRFNSTTKENGFEIKLGPKALVNLNKLGQ